MFDVGFWELGMIMLIALLVIGPERLPGLARKIGLYLGKAQRMAGKLRDEVNKEIAADELKKHLTTQANSDGGEFDFIEETKKDFQSIKDNINQTVNQDVGGTLADARMSADQIEFGNPPPAQPGTQSDTQSGTQSGTQAAAQTAAQAAAQKPSNTQASTSSTDSSTSDKA